MPGGVLIDNYLAIITVSALPDFVRPLNLQLSINEPAFCQCRFSSFCFAIQQDSFMEICNLHFFFRITNPEKNSVWDCTN